MISKWLISKKRRRSGLTNPTADTYTNTACVRARREHRLVHPRAVGMVTELRQGYYLREYRSFFDAGAIGAPEEPAKPQPTGITKGPLTVGARRVDRKKGKMHTLVIPSRAVPAHRFTFAHVAARAADSLRLRWSGAGEMSKILDKGFCCDRIRAAALTRRRNPRHPRDLG